LISARLPITREGMPCHIRGIRESMFSSCQSCQQNIEFLKLQNAICQSCLADSGIEINNKLECAFSNSKFLGTLFISGIDVHIHFFPILRTTHTQSDLKRQPIIQQNLRRDCTIGRRQTTWTYSKLEQYLRTQNWHHQPLTLPPAPAPTPHAHAPFRCHDRPGPARQRAMHSPPRHPPHAGRYPRPRQCCAASARD